MSKPSCLNLLNKNYLVAGILRASSTALNVKIPIHISINYSLPLPGAAFELRRTIARLLNKFNPPSPRITSVTGSGMETISPIPRGARQ
jgi:hypothetical protein